MLSAFRFQLINLYMLKLYFPYFIYGFFIFYVNLLMWYTFGAQNNFAGYLTMYSSALLFAVVSGLSLFYPKVAAVASLVCVVGTAVLERSLLGQISWDDKKASTIALVGLLLGLVVIINSVRVLLNKAKPEAPLKKNVRIGLAIVPFLLFAYWLISVWVRG